MRKNSLTENNGLSLSQAQSVSNLCNQRAGEITKKFSGVNNYSKSVNITQGGSTKDHVIVIGVPLPSNVKELLLERAALYACQAFLMENIKAKDLMLKQAKTETPDISSLTYPVRGNLNVPTLLLSVNEEWGWEQLSVAETNEYLEAEAFAAHIGQFIHRDGLLDHLRNELPNIPAIEWMTIRDGEKSPVTIEKHHTSENLLQIHEELAALHRGYEQKVNYFKAKVKNLVTNENARIANVNANAQNEAEAYNSKVNAEYDTALRAYNEKLKTIKTEFEKARQEKIKQIASMRIQVDPRFQKIVDIFLKQLPETEE